MAFESATNKRPNEMAGQTNARTTKVPRLCTVAVFNSPVLYDFLYGNVNERLTMIKASGLRRETHRENSFSGHVDYSNTL